METRNQNDLFMPPPRLPSTLNVLTILTFIGCGLGFLFSLYGITAWSKHDAMVEKMEKSADEASGFAKDLAQGSLEMYQKQYDNRYVLLGVGLACLALCLIGAIMMRKLKKSGYMLYVIGELTPIVVSAGLIGFGSLMASISTIFGAVIALVFVILYGTQRKYMVN